MAGDKTENWLVRNNVGYRFWRYAWLFCSGTSWPDSAIRWPADFHLPGGTAPGYDAVGIHDAAAGGDDHRSAAPRAWSSPCRKRTFMLTWTCPTRRQVSSTCRSRPPCLIISRC